MTIADPDSRRKKIITTVIIASAVLFLVFCSASGYILFQKLGWKNQTDPTNGKVFGHEIADYTLPNGYKEGFGKFFINVKTVFILDASGEPTIFLNEWKEGLPMTPEKFIDTIFRVNRVDSINWTAQKTRSVVIRNQNCELIEFKGISNSGKFFKGWSSRFSGKSGPALIAIVSPEVSWDGEAAQEFIDSMQ
jgi:hypothetical protein